MGACFASTTKTAQNSLFGGEIIQNVGLRGGSIYIYIYTYVYVSTYIRIPVIFNHPWTSRAGV